MNENKNILTDTDFSNLKNLTYLDLNLYKNETILTDAAFSNLINLTHLKLDL